MVSGQQVKKLVKDGLIIRQPQIIHSRSRALRHAAAKRKGRHSGPGEFRPQWQASCISTQSAEPSFEAYPVVDMLVWLRAAD